MTLHPRGALALAAALLVLLPSGVRAQERAGEPPRAAVSPDSADVLRERMERPPDGHGVTAGDVVNAPLELAFLPVRLVVYGLFDLAEVLLRPGEPSLFVRVLGELGEAGLRPTAGFMPGPRSGVGGGIRYDGLSPLFVEGSASVRGSWRFGGGVLWEGGEMDLRVAAFRRRWAEPRVWGVGPDTPEAAEAAFEWERTEVLAEAGLEAGRHRAGASVGWEENRVGPGEAEGLPDVGTVFPPGALPGAADPTRFVTAGLRGSLDLLDRDTLVVSGLHVDARADGFEGTSDTPGRFVRLDLDTHALLPLSGTHTLVLRVRSALTRSGDGPVPFTHLPSLGGEGGLRAYDRGRFRDRDLLVGAVELHYDIMRIVRERGRAEAFVFYEEGAVAPSLSELSESHSSYGFGLLFKWLGEIRGRAWLAFGGEGARVSAGLGSPL